MSQPVFGGPYGGMGMGFGGPFGGMGMYGQGFGGFDGLLGPAGQFNPFGDFEDDQNAGDVDQDEHLKSTKARLEKYLQKQWQLGKRKLQVQVDFGNVPLEWEYLNQYHGVRHPLAMTAF